MIKIPVYLRDMYDAKHLVPVSYTHLDLGYTRATMA